jgi:hypothetical protein
MKQILFFVLLTFLTLPVLGQKKFNEIDLKINGVGSGATYLKVVKRLGKPLRSKTQRFNQSEACSGKAETHLTLFYSGLKVTLLGVGKGQDLSVYSTEVTSKKWDVSGIRIGTNIKDIIAKFGAPTEQAERSKETILYYVTKDNLGTINFHFQNNKLVKARMTETLC